MIFLGFGHTDVNHHKLRRSVADSSKQLDCVASLTHDLEAGAFEQARHSLAVKGRPPASRYQGWAPAATTCAASSTIVERYEGSLGLPHEQTTFRASSSRDCGPESWGADCPTRAGIARGAPRGR